MASQALKPEMTDEEFDRHAMQVLARELGPGGLARFISLHRSGNGNYACDRDKWLGGITIEDIERKLKA